MILVSKSDSTHASVREVCKLGEGMLNLGRTSTQLIDKYEKAYINLVQSYPDVPPKKQYTTTVSSSIANPLCRAHTHRYRVVNNSDHSCSDNRGLSMNWDWQEYRHFNLVMGVLLLAFSVAFGTILQQPGAGIVGTIRALSMEHSYTLMVFAALTGILSRPETPDLFQTPAQRVHKGFAYGAGILVLLHILTQFETVFFPLEVIQQFLTGNASDIPPWKIPVATGIVIGFASTIVTTIAVLSFLRPRYFRSPFNAVATHTFAYTGFAFATIHSLAFNEGGTEYIAFTILVFGVLGLQLLWTLYRKSQYQLVRQ